MGFLRSRLGRVLIGVLIGAMVGVGGYYATRLAGQALFAIVGAVTGAVAAIVLHAYSRTTRLTHVVVTIPQLSQLHFVVDRESQQAAWRFYVEIVTRVTAQPLHLESGSVREALASLYGLFAVVRSTLQQSHPSREVGDGPTVELLAIAMLNNELRPFLTHWHPTLKQWEMSNPAGREIDWPGNASCREELAAMQRRLLAYVFGFAKLAGISQRTAEAILHGQLGNAYQAPTPRHDSTAVASSSG